ncbi:hypothetical protein FGIG_00302 [Fasciola gigantica]|uniref:Uncharacterized protein n=1 Tax=Fasciola gigantica TaxID=46835 RepID=A0A504XM63_FASGI|nr:hypothetical protein FGIG_00302 [Fasciola gigantica]
MDQHFNPKNSISFMSPQNRQIILESHDQNDTIDCFTLPEIDVTNELSCCHAILPGSVLQNRAEPSAQTTLTDSRDANTCNIISPEFPRLYTESFASEQMGDDNLIPGSHRMDTQSIDQSEETIRQNKPLPISNGPVRHLRVPKHRTKEDGEYSDMLFSSARDNLDSSNVSKPPEVKRDNARPTQISPYAKYVFDPPKVTPLCPKSKRTPISLSAAETTEDGEVPRSVVYVTKQPETMYQLEFYTKNVALSPLYVGERFGVQPANDKKVQPSHYEYRAQSPKNEVSLFYVRQKYAVSVDENPPKTYKYALPPIRVYTDEIHPSRKRSVSDANKLRDSGCIFFQYREILFRVKCTPMHIAQMKTPVSEDILERMAKLNMPSSESRKNKGVVIVRCGYDLMQVTFDMDQINLTRVELKGTVAVQTEDKMVYIREKSRITGRSLLLAVPESTYFYRDPMRNIHRIHANFQRSNVMPLWKYELMRNRLAERRGASEAEAKIEHAFKQTRGSRLYFEGLDSLITAQGGLMCCDISLGLDKYEALMTDEYQSRNSRRRRMTHLWARRAKSTREQSYEDPPDTVVSTQMAHVGSVLSDDREGSIEENSPT